MPHLSRSNLRPTQYARDTNMFRRIGDKFRTSKRRNCAMAQRLPALRMAGESVGLFIVAITPRARSSTMPRIPWPKAKAFAAIFREIRDNLYLSFTIKRTESLRLYFAVRHLYWHFNLALIGRCQDGDVHQPGPGAKTTMSIVKKLFADQSGATAIEYGLIAALIAVAIITAATTVGTNLGTTFTTIGGKL